MRTVVFFIFIFSSLTSISQSLYRSDYVETFDPDWSGVWWTPSPTTNYYTNASVSPTSSAVIYGSGGGSSAYESDWYSFPNIVVNPSNDYYFKFRLGSYRFTSTATTRGVDAADYVTVQLSTDGGTTYINEIRITGNANAYWNYNTGSSYTKTANGTLSTIGPSAGGDRTSTGDGYSVIQLNIPSGTTQIAIDIFARANAAGEEWWLDNFELYEIVNVPLPVELIYFEGSSKGDYNRLIWSTSSEFNTDYFSLDVSNEGEIWKEVNKISAAGWSNQKIDYQYNHIYSNSQINYYRLVQYDRNGEFEVYGPIAIDNRKKTKKIVKHINLMGQEVSPSEKGLIIVVYEDGTVEKIVN